MKTHKVITSSVLLEVFEFNPQGDETLILIHGGPGIAFYMHDVARILEKKFRVLAFNQRGTGKSQAFNNSYTLSDYLHDIEQIIDVFKIESYHILGHAWGGLLGQYITLLNPDKVKSLFLCNSFIGTGKHWNAMENEIMEYNASGLSSFKLFINQMLDILVRIKHFRFLALKQLVSLSLSNYKNRTRTIFHRYHLPEICMNTQAILLTRQCIINTNSEMPIVSPELPVLIFKGANDFIIDNHWRLEENWSDAQNIILENCGHFPWLEAPKDFNSILNSYYDL